MEYNTELYHHGILGMKWGIRRYQNKDGTLTKAGKRKYKQLRLSEDYVKTATIRKKHHSELSNQELQEINRRLQLENNYKKLTTDSNKNKGKSITKTFIKTAGTLAAIDGAIVAYQKIGKKYGKQIVNAMSNKIVNDLTTGLAKPLTS